MNTVLLKTKKCLTATCLSFLIANVATAAGNAQSLSSIAKNVQGNILSIVTLLIVIAYVAGVGFALAGILQFKAHKENPAQVPLSKPIVLIAVAACLLFLPTIMQTAGSTVFGTSATSSLSAPSTSGITVPTNN